MARIPGVEPNQAGLFTKIVYAVARRKVGKVAGKARVVEPLKVHAHHPRLFFAMGQMEMGQEAANAVDPALKTLASIKVATLIGCPY